MIICTKRRFMYDPHCTKCSFLDNHVATIVLMFEDVHRTELSRTNGAAEW